jgi:hypothetical protein
MAGRDADAVRPGGGRPSGHPQALVEGDAAVEEILHTEPEDHGEAGSGRP